MEVKFFPAPEDFRSWLEANHESEVELVVGYYKVGSGKPSMTWSQSVDQALCFGWIDGVRRSIDAESYSIRFTPRKRNSIWSAINIAKVENLTNAGLMTAAGLNAFSYRTEQNSRVYSHEKEQLSLSIEYEKQFRNNEQAWSFFNGLAPSYRRVVINWIMSAKQEKTRLLRLAKAISKCGHNERII